jgi:hypothetical protein
MAHNPSSRFPSTSAEPLRRRRGGSTASASASADATTAAASPLASTGPNALDAQPVFTETYDGLRKHRVAWDAAHQRFKVVTESSHWGGFGLRTGRFLKLTFLPDNVTPDYYTYTKWRVLQRLVSATVSVFGTRALLLALGVKTERVGLTATFNWIQKDAFGKFGRIMWAGKMGRRFDSDAKRWRFRSSLLYAAGTGLEVLTYVFPSAFLLLATVANTLKQMSMLTSSATRNAMYKSFAGDSQNLGDITAKGEAQIAVVDLLGILLGISLSKMIGTARVGMALAYIFLSVVDVFAIYNEIRSVVFTTLNLERAAFVVRGFVEGGKAALPLPFAVSRLERIFLAPKSLDPAIFRTVSQTGCSLEQLHRLREAFGAEKFMVTWGRGVGPSIVLHADAREPDVLRALLVWSYFVDAAKARPPAHEHGEQGEEGWALELLSAALAKAREGEQGLMEGLVERGWDVKHFVFGKIKNRTDW